MRRLKPIILALSLALATAASLAGVARAHPAAGPRPTPGPPPSNCVGDGSVRAMPRTMLLGETAAVTLNFRAVCVAEPIPLNIVLVVDPSEAMGGDLVHELQGALVAFVDRMRLPDNPGTRFAVVVVDEEATTASRLSNDAVQVKRAFGRIEARGDTRIELGIEEGLRLIQQAKMSDPYPFFASNDVMYVFADGHNAGGCRAPEKMSRKARSNGVIVIGACVGRDCDRRCMRSVASSARYFFPWGYPLNYWWIFERIRHDMQRLTIRRMTIVETLPPNIAYVKDSAEPVPSAVLTEPLRLAWTQNFVPNDGLTVTFRVQPLAAGHHPLSLGGRAEFQDNQDRFGSITLPIPFVDVFMPQVVPTATAVVP